MLNLGHRRALCRATVVNILPWNNGKILSETYCLHESPVFDVISAGTL